MRVVVLLLILYSCLNTTLVSTTADHVSSSMTNDTTSWSTYPQVFSSFLGTLSHFHVNDMYWEFETSLEGWTKDSTWEQMKVNSVEHSWNRENKREDPPRNVKTHDHPTYNPNGNRDIRAGGGYMTIQIQNEESFLDSPILTFQHVDPYTHSSVETDEVLKSHALSRVLAMRYRLAGSTQYGKVLLRARYMMQDYALSQQETGNVSSTTNVLNSTTDTHFQTLHTVYFPMIGDGSWHIAYVPLDPETLVESNQNDWNVDNTNSSPNYHHSPTNHTQELQTLLQFRIHPACSKETNSSFSPRSSSSYGTTFWIDWIRLVRQPRIYRITGCHGNEYSSDPTFHQNITYPTMNSTLLKINGILSHVRTQWNTYHDVNVNESRFDRYARTYNCLRSGGENITLEGKYFGMGGIHQLGAPAHVFIDELPCTYVRHDPITPQEKLTCITPTLNTAYYPNPYDYISESRVEIRNGKLPGLQDVSSSFRFARHPPVPRNIQLSNFAARSIDVSWTPGGGLREQLTITGYIIRWRPNGTASWTNSMVTGNITTTTIRTLKVNSEYCFGVVALSEDQSNPLWWSALDLYGRRERLDKKTPSLESSTSPPICGQTLSYDVRFESFSAFSTQNQGPTNPKQSLGPTAVTSGEGHFGLVLIDDANIENCNSSFFCCDSYDPHYQKCSDESSLTCRVHPFYYYNTVDDNSEDETLFLPRSDIVIEKVKDVPPFISFQSACGPTLRLTGSQRNQRGAAWYPRQLEVLEGFDTSFTFRISNPSVRCNNLNGVYKHCRSRGADGLAFVIQTDSRNAIGGYGRDLGYGGIHNSIAVEFDTYYNFEDESEPYENHVSVHATGQDVPNSSQHRFSLGDTSEVPDLTDGNMRVRIKYEPVFDVSQLPKESFVIAPQIASFFRPLAQQDVVNEGMSSSTQTRTSSWAKKGLGMLKVYCQNMHEPILIVPLHLGETVNLHRGRAWVGFTASTGEDTWQNHDILTWEFVSLRMDDGY